MLSLIRSQKYDPNIEEEEEEEEDEDEALMETKGGNYASTSSSSLVSTTKGRLDDSNDYYYKLKQCLHVFFQRSLQVLSLFISLMHFNFRANYKNYS